MWPNSSILGFEFSFKQTHVHLMNQQQLHNRQLFINVTLSGSGVRFRTQKVSNDELRDRRAVIREADCVYCFFWSHAYHITDSATTIYLDSAFMRNNIFMPKTLLSILAPPYRDYTRNLLPEKQNKARVDKAYTGLLLTPTDPVSYPDATEKQADQNDMLDCATSY
uniref:Uncharacterized protein n=1 Tax=Glossina pallidipes TaxID=7398 RepID=A0A1B0AH47_GLOPL